MWAIFDRDRDLSVVGRRKYVKKVIGGKKYKISSVRCCVSTYDITFEGGAVLTGFTKKRVQIVDE